MRRVGVEREDAGPPLEADHAEGVEVGRVREFVAQGLFGRHVGRRAHRAAGAGLHEGGGGQQLGHAEVGEVGVAVLIEQDVLRLQVAVDHAAPVRVVEGTRHVAQQGEAFRRAQRTLSQPSREVATGHVAQRHPRHAVLDAEAVERDDRRVFERGDGLRFLLEARDEARLVSEILRQDLQCHLSREA